MNGHLLDTSTIRHWYSKRPSIDEKMLALPGDDLLYISNITLGELEFAHLCRYANDKAKQDAFRRWLKGTFEDRVLVTTEDTARSYAHLRRLICDHYFRAGKQIELFEDSHANRLGIDENDLWLVAQAHEHGLHFITSDKMTRIKEVLDGRTILGQTIKIDYWPPT